MKVRQVSIFEACTLTRCTTLEVPAEWTKEQIENFWLNDAKALDCIVDSYLDYGDLTVSKIENIEFNSEPYENE